MCKLNVFVELEKRMALDRSHEVLILSENKDGKFIHKIRFPYKLFLDDRRFPPHEYITKDDIINDNFNLYSLNGKFILVKSIPEFIEVFNKLWDMGSFPNEIHFDHDLLDNHYNLSMQDYFDYDSPEGKGSGLEAIEFLIKFIKHNGIINIKNVYFFIHSLNHVGVKNMARLLKSDPVTNQISLIINPRY